MSQKRLKMPLDEYRMSLEGFGTLQDDLRIPLVGFKKLLEGRKMSHNRLRMSVN